MLGSPLGLGIPNELENDPQRVLILSPETWKWDLLWERAIADVEFRTVLGCPVTLKQSQLSL